MNSQPSKQPQKIIEAIIDRLDEKGLKKAIDEPVEKAVQSYRYEHKKYANHGQIQKLLSDFTAYIYKEGLKNSFVPADLPAHTIFVLDRYYQGNYSNGHTAAIIDIINGGSDSVKIVLQRIAEIFKTIEREKCINAVFKNNIDISDWHHRCKIVEYLLSKYKSRLTVALQNCHPSQLADDIPYLLSIIINSSSALQQAIDSL